MISFQHDSKLRQKNVTTLYILTILAHQILYGLNELAFLLRDCILSLSQAHESCQKGSTDMQTDGIETPIANPSPPIGRGHTMTMFSKGRVGVGVFKTPQIFQMAYDMCNYIQLHTHSDEVN